MIAKSQLLACLLGAFENRVGAADRMRGIEKDVDPSLTLQVNDFGSSSNKDFYRDNIHNQVENVHN